MWLSILVLPEQLTLHLSHVEHYIYMCVYVCVCLYTHIYMCMCLLCHFSFVWLFFDSMDCRLPGSSVHRIFPGKNTGAGCHFLLQGIFLTQGSKLHLLCFLHLRQILHHWTTGEPIYVGYIYTHTCLCIYMLCISFMYFICANVHEYILIVPITLRFWYISEQKKIQSTSARQKENFWMCKRFISSLNNYIWLTWTLKMDLSTKLGLSEKRNIFKFILIFEISLN